MPLLARAQELSRGCEMQVWKVALPFPLDRARRSGDLPVHSQVDVKGTNYSL